MRTPQMRKRAGWYATFAFLIVVSFLAIHQLTGMDALGMAGRFAGKALSYVGGSFVRLVSGSLQMLARGIGWRRLSRTVTALAGVRLGYAASVVMHDHTVGRAHGWRNRLRALLRKIAIRWRRLPLLMKVAVVAALIASQVYLHFVLIIFPIAFMVPITRRVFVAVADRLIGSWYWKFFGTMHRTLVTRLQGVPGVRPIVQGHRLLRLRYLSAWRLWRYDTRYRDPVTNTRRKSLVEPIRLWWRRELDTYVGRPLLSGRRGGPPETAHESRNKSQDDSAAEQESGRKA